MCRESVTTFYSCRAVLTHHDICLAYIEHTALQIDTADCPYFRRDYYDKNNEKCYCKVNGGPCARQDALDWDRGRTFSFEKDEASETLHDQRRQRAKVKQEEEDMSKLGWMKEEQLEMKTKRQRKNKRKQQRDSQGISHTGSPKTSRRQSKAIKSEPRDDDVPADASLRETDSPETWSFDLPEEEWIPPMERSERKDDVDMS